MLNYIETVIYSVIAALAMYLHLENAHQAHIISIPGEAASRIVRYQSNLHDHSKSKYVVAPVWIMSNPKLVNYIAYLFVASCNVIMYNERVSDLSAVNAANETSPSCLHT